MNEKTAVTDAWIARAVGNSKASPERLKAFMARQSARADRMVDAGVNPALPLPMRARAMDQAGKSNQAVASSLTNLMGRKPPMPSTKLPPMPSAKGAPPKFPAQMPSSNLGRLAGGAAVAGLGLYALHKFMQPKPPPPPPKQAELQGALCKTARDLIQVAEGHQLDPDEQEWINHYNEWAKGRDEADASLLNKLREAHSHVEHVDAGPGNAAFWSYDPKTKQHAVHLGDYYKNEPYALAHELGHAAYHETPTGAFVQGHFGMNTQKIPNWAAALTGALAGFSDSNVAVPLSLAAIPALKHIPSLMSESNASRIGLDKLKEHGADQEQMDVAKYQLGDALGSYKNRALGTALATYLPYAAVRYGRYMHSLA